MRFTTTPRGFAAACALLLAAGAAWAQPDSMDTAPVLNPHSPRYGHPYRHGAVPTHEAHERMRQWREAQRAAAGTTTDATGAKTLSFGGGVDGIGVTSGRPKVYLVVYGAQWGVAGADSSGNMTLSNDPAGALPYLQRMFKGLGTNGETWSGVMTQYCDGIASGSTSCPAGAAHVGYPSGGSVLAGVWYDNSAYSPQWASGHQLATEAVRAAWHFGNTTAASNRYAQYVILSPSGTTPDGFNTQGSGFCAWHDWNGDTTLSGGGSVYSGYGDIAFTNMPYVWDAGRNCGANWVSGPLDGFSIVEGHEYAETITDQNPRGGWSNWSTGDENADECSWITSGQGAMQSVALSTGWFPMQSTWSNDTNRCDIAHPIVGASTQLLGNSGFENGYASPWWMSDNTLCTASSCSGETAHSGSWFAWLNGWGSAHTDTVQQTVTIPAGKSSAVLGYYLHIDTNETSSTPYDTLQVQVLDSAGQVVQTLATYSNANWATGYQWHGFYLNNYIGQTITVRFVGTEDASLQTSFVLDDVTLTVQ
jgi:serine protease